MWNDRISINVCRHCKLNTHRYIDWGVNGAQLDCFQFSLFRWVELEDCVVYGLCFAVNFVCNIACVERHYIWCTKQMPDQKWTHIQAHTMDLCENVIDFVVVYLCCSHNCSYINFLNRFIVIKNISLYNKLTTTST